MLELTLRHVLTQLFTQLLTIVGAVTGIWGIVSCFVEIKTTKKIKVSTRTAIKLLAGLFCIVSVSVIMADTGANNTPPDDAEPEVSLNYAELDLSVDDSLLLFASVRHPDGQISRTAIWISSDPTIAEVDMDGRVSARAAGTARIIAQADIDGEPYFASCLVTVSGGEAKPDGYSIQLSTNRAILGETFQLSVTPYDDEFTEIEIHTISPSGIQSSFPLSAEGKYLIDTETGTWTIYASVSNSSGTYTASREEDYVTIEILGVMDIINRWMT